MVMMMVVCLRSIVSTAFRIESGVDLCDGRAQIFKHVPDHVVSTDADVIGVNLSREMPISKVPRQDQEVMPVATTDFIQRLRCRHDLHDPPVFQLQTISISQKPGLGKIQQEGNSVVGCQFQPTSMAVSFL